MQLIQVTLAKAYERKNTVRYNAQVAEEQQMFATVPNIYVRKTALAAAFSGFPEKIKVTIELE